MRELFVLDLGRIVIEPYWRNLYLKLLLPMPTVDLAETNHHSCDSFLLLLCFFLCTVILVLLLFLFVRIFYMQCRSMLLCRYICLLLLSCSCLLFYLHLYNVNIIILLYVKSNIFTHKFDGVFNDMIEMTIVDQGFIQGCLNYL